MIELRKPTLVELPAYADALRRGWSPDNVRGKATADDHLRRIKDDAAAFVASLDDPEAKGPPFAAPDGTLIPRLPGFNRWLWDGEFCGTINLRWQRGTSALPPHILGHIGYAVVPWKQGRGYATEALKRLLPECRAHGLTYVELTTDPDNIPSQKVITSNGGVLVERFTKTAAYGGKEALRWRIDL
ncbi:MAG: GNAT family N-acetyltransferase [Alphaproteobacteria bacterium]|nr:GNAT family N-acetyltransferase [Alphaproteobacteria bacterium]